MHWKDFPLNIQVHKPLDTGIQDSFPLLNTERQHSSPSPSVNITKVLCLVLCY